MIHRLALLVLLTVAGMVTASPTAQAAAPPNPCVYYYDQEHAESYYICPLDYI